MRRASILIVVLGFALGCETSGDLPGGGEQFWSSEALLGENPDSDLAIGWLIAAQDFIHCQSVTSVLRSLRRTDPDVSVQIVLIDDVGTDAVLRMLARERLADVTKVVTVAEAPLRQSPELLVASRHDGVLYREIGFEGGRPFGVALSEELSEVLAAGSGAGADSDEPQEVPR